MINYFNELIDEIQKTAESFFNSLSFPSYPKALYVGVALFSFSFGVFAFLAPNILATGDAVVYEKQILSLDFSYTTIHLGYFILAAPFLYVFKSSPDYVLNLANCFFGSLSVVVVYLIASTVFRKQFIGIASGLLLFTNYLFVLNSIYAEVYISQSFLLLLTFYLLLCRRVIVAGLIYALAVLVTPSSLFFAPLYLLISPNKRTLVYFVGTAFSVVAVILAPNLNDYLYGGRGLLRATDTQVVIHNAFLKELYEVYFGLFAIVPFVFTGFFLILREKRLRIFILALSASWCMVFIFGERFGDVPAQLPNYAFLCILGARGISSIMDISSLKSKIVYVFLPITLSFILLLLLDISIAAEAIKIAEVAISEKVWIANLFVFALIAVVSLLKNQINNLYSNVPTLFLALVLGINAFWVYKLVNLKNTSLLHYRDTVLRVDQFAAPDYIVVGSWNEGILFEHFVFQKTYTGRWISTEFLYGEPDATEPATKDQWQNVIEQRNEIWILGYYPVVFDRLEKEGYVIEPFEGVYHAYVSP